MSKLAQKIDILHKTGKTVFSTNELAIYWEIENKDVLYVNIARMKKGGFLKTVQRGLYCIAGVDINELELAGSLKKNSYVSFETVLAKEGIIHQWHGAYFSASDRKLKIENNYGKFIYRRLAENILNNRLGIDNVGHYFIATKERAICDYFYKVNFQQLDDLSDVDTDKIIEISKIYNNKRLEDDIHKLIKLIHEIE
jgi:predicted transcriptional regulator of viral defense system